MTPREPFLPIAPLVPYIRHRERLIGGRQELAKRIHDELGITEAGAARMLDCRHREITLKRADKLCTALGLHVGLVWGMDVYSEGVVEEPVTVAS